MDGSFKVTGMNDSQDTHYRDHVFAYPTSNGVIDTVQWEGFREGIDDTRYVASLIKKEGSEASAKTIVSAGLSNNENMATIRKNVINQMLPSRVNRAPVLTAIGNKSVGAGSPLTFTIRATDPDGDSLTYSASDLPANATFNPTTRTFAWTPTTAQVGISMVTFSVSDGSFHDTESVWITSIVNAAQPTTATAGTAPVVTLAVFSLAVFTVRVWRE